MCNPAKTCHGDAWHSFLFQDLELGVPLSLTPGRMQVSPCQVLLSRVAAALWQLPVYPSPGHSRGINEASPLQTFCHSAWLTGLLCEVRILPSWTPGFGLGRPPLVPKVTLSPSFPTAEGFLIAQQPAPGCRPL